MSSRTIFITRKEDPQLHQNISIADLHGEIWKTIPEYNETYQVSNFGRIKCKVETYAMIKVFILKQTISNKGYARVRILKGKNKKGSVFVHRLVALTFIPNPENKATVNHKDGNKLNNKIDNLEWSTIQENTIHAYKSGLINIKTGQDSHSAKLRNEIVLAIFNDTSTTKEIALKYGIHENTVLNIKAGRSWGKITGKQNEKSFAKAYKTELTPAKVVDIFNMPGTQKEIAKIYGISKSTVWRIKSGTCFSDLTGKKII